MTFKTTQSTPIPAQSDLENQREFRCKCSKVYKSYPALYTHIKNKHPNKIEEFKSESKRPKDGEIDKGRPKKHRERPKQVDEQGDLLNIIELGIMDIEQNLRNQVYDNHEEKFEILQGNAKIKDADLKNYYRNQKNLLIHKIVENIPQEDNNQLILRLNKRSVSDFKNDPSVRVYKEDIKFKCQLIQHFNAVTAAKILIQLELLQIEQEPLDSATDINGEINLTDSRTMFVNEAESTLWGRNENIIRVIREIHSKWHSKLNALQGLINCNERHSNNSGESGEEFPQADERQEIESQSSDSESQSEGNQKRNDLDDMVDSCLS